MAIKTFTTGEVLTAADTNTYLANSGLVFVKQQTVGSGVTSVTVSDAFSATYENYKIIWTGGTLSIVGSLNMTLGATTSNYYNSLVYASYAAGAVAGVGNNAGSAWTFVGYANTQNALVTEELFQPFLTKNTFISSSHCQFAGQVGGSMQGMVDTSTSYTSFAIVAPGGTMTGGTISVYGYRKG